MWGGFGSASEQPEPKKTQSAFWPTTEAPSSPTEAPSSPTEAPASPTNAPSSPPGNSSGFTTGVGRLIDGPIFSDDAAYLVIKGESDLYYIYDNMGELINTFFIPSAALRSSPQ